MRPIVFDCDGVLVDSEALAWSAWREMLDQHGIDLTSEDVALLTGRTDRDAHVHFSQRGTLPDYAAFWEELSEITYLLFDQHLPVASSSSRERLDRSLAATGLHEFFEFAVGGDEVSQGKPAPDLFLAAAAGLDVAPTDCLAVEDTPAGIFAARQAGMTVIAVQRGRYALEDLRAADLVVPRLTPAPFLG